MITSTLNSPLNATDRHNIVVLLVT